MSHKSSITGLMIDIANKGVGMNVPTQGAMQKLWEVCHNFIQKEKVSCDEAIYQTDNIILASPELVYEVAEIVGYYEYPEDK